MTFSFDKKMFKAILNDGPYEWPLDKDKKEFVQSYLIKYHNNIKSLTINRLWVVQNKQFKHNNFYFSGVKNGVYIDVGLLSTSNVSSIKNKSCPDRRIVEGMREAISNDLIEFKKEKLQSIDQCALCGCDLDLKNSANIHVDHCGLNEFRHIKDEFLASKPELIAMERPRDYAGLTQLVDNDHKQLWIDFHREKCQLQLTCARCNLQKSKL